MKEAKIGQKEPCSKFLNGCTWEFSMRGAGEFIKGTFPTPADKPSWADMLSWKGYESRNFSEAGEELNILAERTENLFTTGWRRQAILVRKEKDTIQFALIFINPLKTSTYPIQKDYSYLYKKGMAAPIFLKGVKFEPDSWYEDHGDKSDIWHGDHWGQKEDAAEKFILGDGHSGFYFTFTRDKSNKLLKSTDLYAFNGFKFSYNKINQDKNWLGRNKKSISALSLQSGVVIVWGEAIPVETALLINAENQDCQAYESKQQYSKNSLKILKEGNRIKNEIELQRRPQ